MESKHSGLSLNFGAKSAAKDQEFNDYEEKGSGRRDGPHAGAGTAEPKSHHNHSDDHAHHHGGLNHHVGAKGEVRSHKHTVDEEEEDEANREFEAMKLKPNAGVSMISSNPVASKIAAGFRINSMNMRDASTGKLVWESDRFRHDRFEGEMEGSNALYIVASLEFVTHELCAPFRAYSQVYIELQSRIERN
jgi:hypothetical protein